MKTVATLRTALILSFLLPTVAQAAESGIPVVFRDVTRAAGLDFQHTNGRAGELFVIEVKGSGVAFVDYDNDGDLDLYAVNGNNLPGAKTETPPINRLYRNNGDGTFTDATAQAGVGDGGYGLGVSAADFDNDGDQDLYISNYGPNVLYLNNGDGTFTDVTAKAGVAGDVWSASAAFCDLNNDGWLDLYVANYLVFDIDSTARLPNGPGFYEGETDVLYLSNGDGTFRDVTRKNLGNPNGKGLGVVCLDYDDDGDLDIYVANDQVANLMYENQGNAVFTDVTLVSGTGVNRAGQPEAGMGVDSGDYDNDGDMDLFVTNYKGESNRLMRNDGGGIFVDATARANLVGSSLPYVTFGTAFFDPDNDGDLDIFVANGHTEETEPDHAQPDQLFENLGNGRYEDVSRSSGAAFAAKFVGRGAAFGDFDNDGDVDLVVNNKNGPLTLLQNMGGNRRNWLAVKTRGVQSNRDAIGARIKISAPGFVRIKDVKTGYSIFSSNDPRVYFGLADLDRVDLEIRWPSGMAESLKDIPANKLVMVTEGSADAVVTDLPRIETHYPDEIQQALAQDPKDRAKIEASVERLRALLAAESTDAASYLDVGEAFLLWIGDRAEQRFADLLAAQPDRLDVLLEYGQYLRHKREAVRAIDVFKRVAALQPDSAQVYAQISALALAVGRYEECAASARRWMELGGQAPAAYLHLGRALAGLGQMEQAEATLKAMIERYPRSAEAYLELGKIYAETERPQLGVEITRRAVSLDPGAQGARYQLAEAYRLQGNTPDYERQMAIFRVLETESAVFKGGMPRDAEIDLLFREIRMNPLFGQTRADRQLARRYGEQGDDDNKDLFSLRARVSKLQDDMADRMNAFRRVLQLDASPGARAGFEEVNALRLRMVKAMNASVRYDIAEAAKRVTRARDALAAGAYDDALTGFKAALVSDPYNMDAYHGLIRFSLSTGFRLDYALALARKAALMDQSATSYRLMADVHRAMGDEASAARALAQGGLT